jgi:hypothetical protein
MDQPHKQKIISILTDVPLDVVQTCLQSYASLVVGVWLLGEIMKKKTSRAKVKVLSQGLHFPHGNFPLVFTTFFTQLF